MRQRMIALCRAWIFPICVAHIRTCSSDWNYQTASGGLPLPGDSGRGSSLTPPSPLNGRYLPYGRGLRGRGTRAHAMRHYPGSSFATLAGPVSVDGVLAADDFYVGGLVVVVGCEGAFHGWDHF
jgi:hypothetical protein